MSNSRPAFKTTHGLAEAMDRCREYLSPGCVLYAIDKLRSANGQTRYFSLYVVGPANELVLMDEWVAITTETFLSANNGLRANFLNKPSTVVSSILSVLSTKLAYAKPFQLRWL